MGIVTRLDITDTDFDAAFARLLISPAEADIGLPGKVSSIVAAVAQEGDVALLRFTNAFDHRSIADAAALHLDPAAMAAAAAQVDSSVRGHPHAADRIRDFHQRQAGSSWQFEDASGSLLGQRISPLTESAFMFPVVGRATSSVLMNAIPAKVAGVSEVVMVPARGRNQPGGHGTATGGRGSGRNDWRSASDRCACSWPETVPRVDKIVGPGTFRR